MSDHISDGHQARFSLTCYRSRPSVCYVHCLRRWVLIEITRSASLISGELVFNGRPTREVYIALPELEQEDVWPAALDRVMYGTQDASSIWQADWTTHLAITDYECGKSQPGVLYKARGESRG